MPYVCCLPVLCVDVVRESGPVCEDKRPLAVLKDGTDLSGLPFAHGDVEEHGVLCAKVVYTEEPGAILFEFFEEPLSLEVLSESHLALGGGEACDDACGPESVGLAVDAGVLDVEADA